MTKFPLKEIKELQNEILKNNKIFSVCKFKIKNLTQFEIIKYLYDNRNKEVIQKEFEEILNIRKSTISGILDTMEKNNIIIRVHDSNKRGKHIRLTDEIIKEMNKIIKEFESVEKSIIEGISDKDLEVFYNVINKMKHNLKKGE